MPTPDVRAAGAVVTRKGGDVLLVHRPRYNDWSFPKGKLDRDEHEVAAAVREVAEETGLAVRLGPRLPTQHYEIAKARAKSVDYWLGRVRGDDDVSGYLANDEIDAVEWVPWAEAAARLTYPYDAETLARARPLRHKTQALVVLRHGAALPRGSWIGEDRRRPLTDEGRAQAQRLVALLASFGAVAIHSSSSVRCVATVTPYVHATGWPLHSYDELSEEGACARTIGDLVEALLSTGSSTVLCTHRPVLPIVFAAMGVEPVRLHPAEALVVHHRAGAVVATERYQP